MARGRQSHPLEIKHLVSHIFWKSDYHRRTHGSTVNATFVE
jgi:hypothetical protein